MPGPVAVVYIFVPSGSQNFIWLSYKLLNMELFGFSVACIEHDDRAFGSISVRKGHDLVVFMAFNIHGCICTIFYLFQSTVGGGHFRFDAHVFL